MDASDRLLGLVEFRIQVIQLPEHESASIADRLVVYRWSKILHEELEKPFCLIRTQLFVELIQIKRREQVEDSLFPIF